MKPSWFVMLFFTCQLNAYANCYDEAGERFKVDPLLLKAIAKVESGEKCWRIGRNTNGSTDLGCMQINSGWLSTLKKHDITRDDLLNDPCQNVLVGAWVLAQNQQRFGKTWRAVGAYNAASESKRQKYANKVAAQYEQLLKEQKH